MTDDRGDPCTDLDFASLHEHGVVWTLPPEARAEVRYVDEGAAHDEALREALSRAPSAPTVPHATYLGASDLGAILGLDPFRTSLDVWAEKTGRVLRSTADELEAGNDHEAGVVAGARRRLLRERRAVSVEYPGPGTILTEIGALDPGRGGYAWRGATLDAVVHLDETRRAVLEAKYVGAGQAHAWGPEPAGIDAIPLRTVAQVHWQTMHARERWPAGMWDRAFVAADIGTDRRLYEIPIDDAMIADLLEAGREWWRAHVVAGVMPEPTSRDVSTLAEIFPHVEREGLSPFPPDELRTLAEDYVVAREITLRHRDELARIGAKIRALLGTAEGYRWQGGRVTWKEDAAGARRLHVKTWRIDR